MPQRVLWCLLLLLSLGTTDAVGDASKREQERRAALRRKANSLLPAGRIETHWIGSQRLLYRVPGQPLRVVDRNSGKRKEAFDAKRLQQDLAKAVGQDRGTVDYRIVGGDDDALWLACEGQLLAVAWKGQAVTTLDPADVEALRLTPTQQRVSRNGPREIHLLFINRSDQPIQLRWVSSGGDVRPYATVAPGTSHRQHTFDGHLWTLHLPDGREVSRYAGKDSFGVVVITEDDLEAKPKRRKNTWGLSPDGKQRVRIEAGGWTLSLVNEKSGKATTLVELDQESGAPFNARPLWSGDGRFVALMRDARAPAEHVHVVDSSRGTPGRGQRLHWPYRKPGDPLPKRWPVVIDIRKKKLLSFDTAWGETWSIDRLRFSADSKRLYFLRNARGHQRMELHAWDLRKSTQRLVIEESSKTFIDYSQKTFLDVVDDGKAWIWMSERSGWNHLWRIDDATAKATPITQGPWLVRAVDRIDHEKREIWFRALGVDPKQDPYHVHHGRVSFDGGDPVWLTDGDGTHELAFAPDREHYVASWSRVDQAPVHELRRSKDGKRIATLHETQTMTGKKAGWFLPERHVMKRRGKADVWGIIHRPSDFDPRKKYPVVEQVYAGPHGHHVPKTYRRWHGARGLCDRGFIVIQSDAPGTNWRHKAWHDACWQKVADAGLEDRVAWIRDAAKTRPWMDVSRVGIYGGSAGGQTAMRALLRHPDFYRVGVADCGCHDNRIDKIWWNEAWMGWPIGKHYAEQSNVDMAPALEGKLLLIVGEIDRNVDPVSTLRVVHALVQADKDFEMLVLPGIGHGAAGTPYGTRRQTEFLVEHLITTPPPKR